MLRLRSLLLKNTIQNQLTGLMFGLTALVIIVLSFLGIRALISSGSRTEAITSSAMSSRVQQVMVQTAGATASANSLIFRDIERQVNSAAAHTADLFSQPQNYTNQSWKFDQRAYQLPAGQYTNSASEPGSLLFPSTHRPTAHNKQVFELIAHLDDLFPYILKNEPNAVAAYFMGNQNEVRYYPNIGLANIIEPDIDVTSQEFYAVANPQNDPEKITKWTNVYDDPAGNGLMITASHPVYPASGVFTGVVAMDVTLNIIAKNIENYSPIESSYAFLIDNKGRAIALPAQGYRDLLGRDAKPKEFGSDLGTVSGDLKDILRNMKAGKSGFAPARVGNTDVYVAYSAVAGTNFSLGLIARQNAALAVVSDLRHQVVSSTRQVLYTQILPAAVIILVLAWLFSYVYVRRFSNPIKSLTENIARISGGDLNVRPAAVQSNNEIGQLARSFNTMVADLKASRKKIDEQNQALLHNEQARLKASINSLNIGFIMTDNHNNPITINGVAETMLAHAAQAAGQPEPRAGKWTLESISDTLGQPFDFRRSLEKVLRTGAPVEHKEIDLGDRIFRMFMAPIRGVAEARSEHLGVVVLIEDITDTKLLERSRDEFFSIASHELRTPLTAIRGNSSLIQQTYVSQMKDPDFAGMVDDIHSASIRLIEIVNDFLDAARLEQGRVKFENSAVSAADIAGAVAAELTAVAKDKGIGIVLDGGMAKLPAVYADKNRVKQIIYNLVGNAMKFTEHGTITIDARVEGKKLKVLVTDAGPGISEENQRLLFRKFRQASNNFVNRDARGTGLGLYISKLLCEQMGGRIALEHTELGKGSTFSFTLPLLSGARKIDKA